MAPAAPCAAPQRAPAEAPLAAAPALAAATLARSATRELWSNMSEETYEPWGDAEPDASAIGSSLPKGDEAAASGQAPHRPAGAPASPASPGQDYGRPQRTWANIVSKDTESAPAGKFGSAGAARKGDGADEPRPRKDTIVDYLLFLAKLRAAGSDTPGQALEMPEELKRFKSCLEAGVNNVSRPKYIRRGMRNDANNCYVNVVIQSLLPCSALMQLLSHCAPSDPDRPFYTGMVRLCKEFHSRRPDVHGEPFNVLLMPQVKEIISTWQSIGAQQDAGEFLFYMLNGMHEECKWKSVPCDTACSSITVSDTVADDDWAQVGKQNRKVEVRSAGVHEDSPVVRIFGGLVRSSLRSKNAKADSVSQEPFNLLILDISPSNVDSVWSALEVYCGAEAVNDGRATKRLHFKVLPKVLILNLKRFSYNKDTGCPQKIKKAVRYDEKLTFDRSWLVDDVEPPEYHLTAVICHHGDSVNGGHYNASVRYDTEWYMYDDALVRQMSLAEVMNQQFTAYLLLYQCHDKVNLQP